MTDLISISAANQEIATSILTAVQAGDAGSWSFPWHGFAAQPTNAFSGRAFRGQNLLSLWAAARKQGFQQLLWASKNSWASKGGSLRSGAKGASILVPVYDEKPSGRWTPEQLRRSKEDQPGIGGDAEGGILKKLLGFRRDTWFNIEEVSGLTFQPPAPRVPPNPVGEAEKVISSYLKARGPALVHGGMSAHWDPSTDRITMPPRSSFVADGALTGDQRYYATLLHECGHSTGSKGRLKRKSLMLYGKSKESRAREELVAELSASFVGAGVGLATGLRKDHVAYIASWMEILRGGDKDQAFSWCVKQADDASRFILSKSERQCDAD